MVILGDLVDDLPDSSNVLVCLFSQPFGKLACVLTKITRSKQWGVVTVNHMNHDIDCSDPLVLPGSFLYEKKV